MSFTAKSVILDIADNWGDANYLGLRSVDFWYDGAKISLAATDFTAYATSEVNSNYLAGNVFDTSLSKTGLSFSTEWYSSNGSTTNQRLIVVFDSNQTFDEIRINNSHSSGGYTDRGAKNVVIHYSTDSITSTTYNASISNSTKLFDGQFDEHSAVDEEDEQTLTLDSGASAAITGTVTTADEADIVAGGKTIILTLTGDTWVATVGTDNAITTALIAGIDSAQSEATGWDAVVKANMDYNDVVRTSDTVVTITLGAEATYDITADETITVTIPATALTGAVAINAGTFNVTAIKYSVTYDGNTNTSGAVPTDSNGYEDGATVTVLGNTGSLTKTNNRFNGWNTAADGTGTSYAAAATFTMGTADVILYAVWEPYVYLTDSTYIASSGTTVTAARLTAPTGKTTTDFQAGYISDDTNPVPGIDLAADKYTEIEFNVEIDAAISSGDEIEFRITDNGVVLDTYSVTPMVTVGIEFLINSINQGQSISTLSLDQLHDLTTANIAQAQSIQALTLDQLHTLITENVDQAQAIDPQTITQLHQIITGNVSQAQTIESPALTQLHTLITDSVAQGQFVEALTLTQLHTLFTANISQTQTLQEPELSQLQEIIIENVSQGQLSEALSLTQLHTLITNAVNQGQSIDEPVIQLLTELVIDNISQGQSIASLTLTQLINIIIADISQDQSIDAATITQLHDLIIVNVLQDQSIDALELEVPGILVIYNVLQGQSVEAPTLAQKIALTLQNVSQSQSIGTLTIDQLHSLACDNINQGQEIDTAALEQLITLAIANISQGQALEEPTFFQVFQLSIDDVSQAQSLGTLSLDQLSELIINNISQGQTIEAINFSIANGLVTVTITAKQPGVTFDGKQPGVTFS